MSEPSGRGPAPRRCDLAAVAILALFVLAAAVPSARDPALAATTLAAALWIGWDAIASDRPGPRARLVMAIALLLIGALPALMLAFDHGLWSGRFPGLTAGLLLWSVGIACLALGSRLTTVARRPDRRMRLGSSRPRGGVALAGVGALAVVCLAAFVYEVGGPVKYVQNLNNSAAEDFSLTYLLWGMSFVKYASYAYLGEAWLEGGRARAWTWLAVAAALALLLFYGSRLLVIVALIQLVLLYAALHPVGRRFGLTLLAAVLAAVIVFVGLGELRRWENLPHHRAFASYLLDTGLPQLPRTYVNDYADGVRLSVEVRGVVPREAPYEYGKEFLRLLLQPIPGSVRPGIAQARALRATFTGQHRNANALPVPVVGYIEFWLAGTALLSLLLGLCVGLVDRLGRLARDVGMMAALIAAGTGAVIVFRGTFHQGVALAGIDIAGFWLAHRILFRRARQQAASLPNPASSGPVEVAA